MSAPSSDRAAIRQTIRTLKEAGWNAFAVNDGEDVTYVRTEREAISAIMAVDEARLYLRAGPAPAAGEIERREVGFVFFVLGNEPDEVIADYTTNLEDVLDPLMRGWWQ